MTQPVQRYTCAHFNPLLAQTAKVTRHCEEQCISSFLIPQPLASSWICSAVEKGWMKPSVDVLLI